MDGRRRARGLGCFSVAVGTAGAFAPRRLGRLVGLRGHDGLLRAFGLCEIVAGVGGHALDLAALGMAASAAGGPPARVPGGPDGGARPGLGAATDAACVRRGGAPARGNARCSSGGAGRTRLQVRAGLFRRDF